MNTFKRIETADTGWPQGPVQVMVFGLAVVAVGLVVLAFVVVTLGWSS